MWVPKYICNNTLLLRTSQHLFLILLSLVVTSELPFNYQHILFIYLVFVLNNVECHKC